jgi:sugar (glycoside-pentoside-hexuronide) transporter
MSENKTLETAKIKIREKLGFLTLSGSNNIVYMFKNLYFMFFLTNVLKIDIGVAGIVVAIGTVWDAVNDPLIGYYSVNHKFKNGEKVRPFALWHSIPWAITIVLLFTDFGLPAFAAAVVSTATYILFEVFNTTCTLPYNAMGSLATNREADRRSINVFRNLGAVFGTAIGSVACLPLLKAFGGLDKAGNLTDGSSRGFLFVAIVMGVLIVIGAFAHYFTSKERVEQIEENDDKISVKEVVRMLFSCKSWLLNSLYLICYGIINLLLMQNLNYYSTYVLGSTAAAMGIQIAFLLADIVTTLFVAPIDKKLGRRKTMMLGVSIAIAGKLWFLVQPASVAAMYVNAVTVGIAIAIAFVLFNTNRNNLVDIIEANSGRRIDSMIAASDGLISKLATAGATLLIAFMLASAGFDANLTVQTPATIDVINITLGWIPQIVTVIMLIAAFFIPIEKDYERAKNVLRERAKK